MADGFVLLTGMAPLREGLARFWPVAAVSFGIALLATPLCRKFALKHGIVDKPDDFLKPHGRPIPYLGGVAICAGWLAGLLAASLLKNPQTDVYRVLGIAAAGVVTMLIGLFDDLRVMNARVKLASNVVVAIFLVCLGIGDDLIRVFTELYHVRFSDQERWLELVYSVPLAVFIIVGSLNATNLIDGLDGLCAGVLGIIAIGFFVLAAHLRINQPRLDIADERIILSLAMLGAAAGFLPFNLNPAKIFLGDAGSMLLGLNAAILILLLGDALILRWMIGALMVFGLPISDMLLTLARRWRNGKPLMLGDRSHFYDQLRDRGLTVRQVVAISYALALGFVLLGLSVLYIPTRYAILVYFLTVCAVVAAIWKFDMVSIEQTSRAPAPADPEQRREMGIQHS